MEVAPICKITSTLPFLTIVPKSETVLTYHMICEVKTKTQCALKTSSECQTLVYKNFEQKPQKSCEKRQTQVPIQHLKHRRECFHDMMN